MNVIMWLETSFNNGELFFYIIPAFLFVILVIVILYPDKKPGTAVPEIEKTPEHEEQFSGKVTIDLTIESTAEHNPIELEPIAPGIDEVPDFEPVNAEPEKKEFKLGNALEKTKGGFMSKLLGLFKNSVVDDALIEELEEILYTADIGVTTVEWLMTEVRSARGSFKSGDDVRLFIKEKIRTVLREVHRELPVIEIKPAVFLMVGVNGAGKTTTIGKLASRFVSEGRVCILAAADTFRAAAVEQLKIWGERSGCAVVSDKDGADPASVAHNAITSAISRNADIVLVDTAGRLQNRVNLMDELSKVKRVIGKARENAPDETILVVDANNGQNALSQARQFGEAVDITGIIVTKLDGTAKGGVIIGIAKELGLPVYLIGTGESLDDLRPFNPDDFVEALFT
ncbi:MAG TPA: signal recognition particle-docking protein FtsY [bacterium]|nr:signal recognition particle-docking protein FtsY [bacterium]HPS29606.1 signal recognition particle-docking protein FtsY [bacterium]